MCPRELLLVLLEMKLSLLRLALEGRRAKPTYLARPFSPTLSIFYGKLTNSTSTSVNK